MLVVVVVVVIVVGCLTLITAGLLGIAAARTEAVQLSGPCQIAGCQTIRAEDDRKCDLEQQRRAPPLLSLFLGDVFHFFGKL